MVRHGEPQTQREWGPYTFCRAPPPFEAVARRGAPLGGAKDMTAGIDWFVFVLFKNVLQLKPYIPKKATIRMFGGVLL